MINQHKDNHSILSKIFTKVIIYGFPFFLFFLVYTYYNFEVLTITEMIKNSGLVAISLLSFVFISNMLSGHFSVFKRAIKSWVIFCIVIVCIHFGLILQYRYNYDLLKLFNPSEYFFWGILLGFLSLIALIYGLIKSLKKSSEVLSNSSLRPLIIVCFLALGLAFVHFYLVESNAEGVLVIKRFLGRIIFAFAGLTVFVNLIIYVVSYLKDRKRE